MTRGQISDQLPGEITQTQKIPVNKRKKINLPNGIQR
jgi:hypothetical protein